MKRLHYAHGIGQFRVLVNHVHSVTDAQTAFENLAGVAGRYLTVSLEGAGCIAADPRMARALELSRCVVDAFPSTPAARDYRHLAAELQYWPMRPAMSSRHHLVAPIGSNSGATRRPTVCAARLKGGARTRGARCITLRERSRKPRF
jgi:flagellar biosynthesis protein FlhG